MKRSSSDGGGPSLKRSLSESSANDHDDESSASILHLSSQNKALCREMKIYKRQLGEARKELDMMRTKSREMESLVSVIQRAWSQLDIDASMLLDALGDNEGMGQVNGCSELLIRLLHAGEKYKEIDPTDMTVLPELKIDEWSSAEEVEAERKRALSSIVKSEDNEEAMDNEFGGKLEENLCGHAAFTLALLERLCIAVNESGIFEQAPEIIQAVVDAKELHAERLMLSDRITKLSSEVIELKSKLHISEKQKIRCEKALDKAAAEVSNMKEQLMQTGGGSGSTGDGTVVGIDGAEVAGIKVSAVGRSAEEADMKRKIVILEKQLAESEAAKAKVEMTLTERLARPMAQTEAQVADMRRAMEELRLQCKQKVSMLLTECGAMQERVAGLEQALAQVSGVAETKCAEVTSRALALAEAHVAEVSQLRSDLASAKAEAAITAQLRQQVSELQALELVARNESQKMKERISSLSTSHAALSEHLGRCRSREVELEKAVVALRAALVSAAALDRKEGDLTTRIAAVMAMPKVKGIDIGGGSAGSAQIDYAETTAAAAAAESKCSEGTGSNDSAGVGLGSSERLAVAAAAAVDFDKLVGGSHARVSELETELEDARANISDLILEIEAMANEEGAARDQVAKLLRQAAEGQGMQSAVLEENLRLHDQVEEVQARRDEMQEKLAAVEAVMSVQESLIAQLRGSEQGVRGELQSLKRVVTSEGEAQWTRDQALVTAEEKLRSAELGVAAERKRNSELQARCDELASQWDSERKARMEAQRDARVRLAKREKERASEGASSSSSSGSSGSQGAASDESAAMLEITLKMLRCSVCRDRFKEVAITRCFHLFCKECIDENLRNRHRKCPACGEKFGQDDVKTIFFTH